MRYSEKVLTENNFDEEVERIYKEIGEGIIEYNSFIEELDKQFTKQTNNGKEEWIRWTFSSDSQCQKGQLAYEFKNGFIVMDFIDIL